ncbi:MAG: hypothetical protein KDJ97_24140 [Anaerolineae bacterium]|nr:hypothetical protein [Anaerolineae bacterium]
MAKKRKRLDLTVAGIQRKFGIKALRRLERADTQTTIPHIPTGFTSLDQSLGIGGIPRGRITELMGVPTSGMITLTLKIIANAQAEGDAATYIDLSRTFDPDYAHRCGVDLATLLLVRPRTGRDALHIALDLIASRGTGILIFDSITEVMAERDNQRAITTALRQFPGALAKSPCAAVFLTLLDSADLSTDNGALAHFATLRLLIEKERWITKHRDVRGYRAQVLVKKNKLGPAGQRATIAITFNGTVRGDST